VVDWLAILFFVVVIALGTSRIWMGYVYLFVRRRKRGRFSG